MANRMTTQSVINTIYAALRKDGHEPLRAGAMLYQIGTAMAEVDKAMEAFGDIPKSS